MEAQKAFYQSDVRRAIVKYRDSVNLCEDTSEILGQAVNVRFERYDGCVDFAHEDSLWLSLKADKYRS